MSTDNTKPIIAIVGPTACGKTARGVALARAIGGEIVSADSRQVYRGMDVGTGKDLADYGSDVPYHLIDIVPAGSHYNLFQYLNDADAALNDIASRGKPAIVVGGTGMYVESLLRGIKLPDVPYNEQLRQTLKGKSLEELRQILATLKTLHNNTDTDTIERAIRAIEIESYYTENPHLAAAREGKPRKAVVIGIDIPREERRRLISERMHRRFDSEDMLGEVKQLISEGVSTDTLITYGLEYRFLTLHLLGKLSRQEMETQLEIAIHQFSKRQMTWFRNMPQRGTPIIWLPHTLSNEEFIDQVIAIWSAER